MHFEFSVEYRGENMIKSLYWTCSIGAKWIYKLIYKFETVGLHNLNSSEKYVVCGNHSNWQDPIIMASVLPFEIRFMGKKELFKVWIVSKFLHAVGVFPVDRDSNDLKAIKKALSILKSGENLGLFPEGTRNKTSMPLPVKSGVVLMALKTKTKILPITIDGNFKFRKPLKVIVHNPIDLSDYYDEKVDANKLQTLANEVMDTIYASKSISGI